MNQIIQYLTEHRIAVATVAFTIALLLWVMRGDDNDEPCRARWALLVAFVVAAVAYFMMKRKSKGAYTQGAEIDDFVTNLRSYYEPHHSQYLGSRFPRR
jgi:hypothetical protein